MDKNEFIQTTAIHLCAYNWGQGIWMNPTYVWSEAKKLYEEGVKLWYFLSAREETQSFPAYVPPAFPRNMHVNGELDVPF